MIQIGETLKNQTFERYFMAETEIVDAKVVATVGEFHLIVVINGEKHKVDFSISGTMRSRGIVS